MRTLELIVVGLGLLFVAVAVSLSHGSMTVVNLVVYPVAGAALVLVVAFVGDWAATAWRRRRRQLPRSGAAQPWAAALTGSSGLPERRKKP